MLEGIEVPRVARMTHDDVPEGMRTDARATWPSPELIESWLGDSIFDLRPGEEVEVPADDEEAVSAARRFRDVLSQFASGVTVVTTMSGGLPVGMTCQSFSSVSLDPPLVMFIPAKTSRAWPLIQRSGKFCVNILAEDQAWLSNQMASRGADKFAGVDWTPAPVTGTPLLRGTIAHLECSIHAVHEAGDHYVVIGRVLGLEIGDVDDPLLFFRGRYATTATSPRPPASARPHLGAGVGRSGAAAAGGGGVRVHATTLGLRSPHPVLTRDTVGQRLGDCGVGRPWTCASAPAQGSASAARCTWGAPNSWPRAWARLSTRWASCSQVMAMPPCIWTVSAATWATASAT